MKKLAILISDTGTGTNLQAIIDAIQQNKLHAEITVVVSDTKDVKGVERAEKNNIPVEICQKKDNLLSMLQPNNYSLNPSVILSGEKNLGVNSVRSKNNISRFTQTIKYSVDYVCLCGWKQIIPAEFIDAFPNHILNLHPGLIPDTISAVAKSPDGTNGLWNKGKLTNVAIENFLSQQATYAGSSIHFLTHDFDFGPVLGRTFERVEPNDTVEMLYQRLKKKENKLYVEVLEKLCNGKN